MSALETPAAILADPIPVEGAVVPLPVRGQLRLSSLAPRARLRPVLYRTLRRSSGATGGLILLLVVSAALFASWLSPGDPLAITGTPFQPAWTDHGHLLGTDSLGRDVLAGLLHGARVSLAVGVSATLLGLAIGTGIGALSGYFGGWIDACLSRLIELFQTIPSFVLLVVLVAITEPTVASVALGIGIVTWPQVARLVRAEFRALRNRDFVMAARGLGYGHGRIMLREILPNALPSLVVTGSVMLASAILMESALSFMGLSDPNRVSWGSMIGAGREFLRSDAMLTALPGAAIMLTVLGVNLLGEAYNAAANPRSEGRS
jgi:peptide/nickel transport system permease protein